VGTVVSIPNGDVVPPVTLIPPSRPVQSMVERLHYSTAWLHEVRQDNPVMMTIWRIA
jgi:hypothetical protein